MQLVCLRLINCIKLFIPILFALRSQYSSISYENALKFFVKSKPSEIEYPLDCATWNATNKNTCPITYPIKHEPALWWKSETCPEYFRWIHEDLRPWKEEGSREITREMLESARKHAHFRVVILDGKVYVEKFKDAIQTRDLFTIWGILQLTRLYPGRLPDLELMFDCDDRPLIPRGPNAGNPPALFGYCSDSSRLDIVFPDWSFWGWAEINLRPWRSMLKEIKEGNRKRNWTDREPYAYWKGNPRTGAWRRDLMRCNPNHTVDWNARLFIQIQDLYRRKRMVSERKVHFCMRFASVVDHSSLARLLRKSHDTTTPLLAYSRQ
ncbi:OLC1v1030161C1 [Oldenlandia corymbosa var. corymbosa]|uniref:OLC1v1030161C1 n=1 Tax=Oldenlandia corymbosa var. corymbosa TaxID=529605 RepID=A0AAV1CIN4_OLDCO|nr:OLC1v1030161C1 [Oldenlandia corymbosa var. corymbosa]